MEENIVKVFKITIWILVLILFTALIWKYSNSFIKRPDILVHPNKQIYELNRFEVDTSKSNDGQNYIKFKNVQGSSATNGEYYNIDLTITTQSDELANKINNNRDLAVGTIRRALGNFRREDVNNANGREYLKNTIRKELAKTYGVSDVEGVYLENFMYEYR